MSFGDLSRINTNVQSLQALGEMQKTNSELGLRQLRLATGSRLNRAEDDSAGYTIAKKLESRVRGQAQAMANVGDAKSLLTVAEGSLGSINDILMTMKEKSVQAANDTLGEQERSAIQGQLNALRSEVDDILADSEFNGLKLFDADNATDFNFQVGAENGDVFAVSIGTVSTDSLFGTITPGEAEKAEVANGATFDNTKLANLTYAEGAADQTFDFKVVDDDGTNSKLQVDLGDGNGFVDTGVTLGETGVAGGTSGVGTVTVGDLSFDIEDGAAITNGQTFTINGFAETEDSGGMDVSSHSGAQTAINTVDGAIKGVSDMLAKIGDSQTRLTFKQENLQASMTNNESARSRIEDADFAKEQMEIVKLQILQQSGISALAQSNGAAQGILSLLR